MKEKEKMLEKNNMTLMFEKMTKESIGKNQVSRNELSKKRSLQEKGITLIALVVTIIILLILAGVTLNIALSDNGLFSKTKEATEKYKQEQSDEEDIISQIATQMYSDEYVGAEVTGYTPTGDSSCTIDSNASGYNNTQTFNRDESMAWKVWDFDGTTLRIIGNPTSEALHLVGAKGYNNGVWAMDYICKELYSNTDLNINATVFKRSDILKVSNYNFSQGVNYGKGVKVSDLNGNEVPEIWEENDKYWQYENDEGKREVNIDKMGTKFEEIGKKGGTYGESVTAKNEEIIKHSLVNHNFEKSEFVNDNYYDLIFKDSNGDFIRNCWLGTRVTYFFAETGIVGFGFPEFGESVKEEGVVGIGHKSVFRTVENGEHEQEDKVRPMVSINIKENGCTLDMKKDTNGKRTITLSWKKE